MNRFLLRLQKQFESHHLPPSEQEGQGKGHPARQHRTSLASSPGVGQFVMSLKSLDCGETGKDGVRGFWEDKKVFHSLTETGNFQSTEDEDLILCFQTLL